MFSANDAALAASQFPGGKRLAKRRLQAAERAVAMGMPSFTEEVWRYSPIDELDIDRYQLFVPKTARRKRNFNIDPGPFVAEVVPAALVSVTNGVVDFVDVSSPGVSIRTLTERYVAPGGAPITQAAPQTATLIGSVMKESVDFFAEANLAFTSAPIVVEIAPGAVLDRPIVVCVRTNGAGKSARASKSAAASKPVMWFPRLVVIAGENSEAVVVEQHTSDEAECLVCPVTELGLAQSAQLSHITVQQMGSQAWQIASQISHLADDARLASQQIALGGAYARARIDTSLLGERSHSDLAAVYFGDGKTELDFRTYQQHVAPNTTSNLLFKGALDDSSKAVYTGLIRIEPTASGVEAFQTNRNLKLSPNAWAESVPNLEIENNDVKCSHASATGPVDADQRFYLERLGVPSDAAEFLVVQGFFDEVLETLPVKQIGVAVGDHIAALLAGRLTENTPN